MSVRLMLCAAACLTFVALLQISARAQTAPVAPAPSAAASSSDDGVIGNILEVEGTGTITPEKGAAVNAVVNAPIHLNDVITTGPKSKVFVLLIDNTQFTLSENAKLTVNEWVYDPDNNASNKGRYSVLDGAFEYVSGLITKKPDPDVQIDTPAGSIGIRGTDLTGGDEDGQYGIHVDEGAVDVKTDAGQVRVNQGEGTSIRGRAFAPDKPRKWTQARLQRMRQRVFLQHRDLVRQRVAQIQGQHKIMQQRYKRYMQAHPGQQMQQQRREQMQQQRGMNEQRREMRQEKFQQRQQMRQQGQDNNKGWRPQQQGQNQNGFGKRLQQMMPGQQPAQAQQQAQVPGQGTLRQKAAERQAERRKRWLERHKDDTQEAPPPAQ